MNQEFIEKVRLDLNRWLEKVNNGPLTITIEYITLSGQHATGIREANPTIQVSFVYVVSGNTGNILTIDDMSFFKSEDKIIRYQGFSAQRVFSELSCANFAFWSFVTGKCIGPRHQLNREVKLFYFDEIHPSMARRLAYAAWSNAEHSYRAFGSVTRLHEKRSARELIYSALSSFYIENTGKVFLNHVDDLISFYEERVPGANTRVLLDSIDYTVPVADIEVSLEKWYEQINSKLKKVPEVSLSSDRSTNIDDENFSIYQQSLEDESLLEFEAMSAAVIKAARARIYALSLSPDKPFKPKVAMTEEYVVA